VIISVTANHDIPLNQTIHITFNDSFIQFSSINQKQIMIAGINSLFIRTGSVIILLGIQNVSTIIKNH
jgi:hypothetical protein